VQRRSHADPSQKSDRTRPSRLGFLENGLDLPVAGKKEDRGDEQEQPALKNR